MEKNAEIQKGTMQLDRDKKTETKGGYLRRCKTGIFLLAASVAIGSLCWIGGTFYGGNKTNQELSAVVLQQKLTEINELATVTYAYTNMAQFENSNNFYGMKIPFTTKKFILTYDGIIKAGVDLSEVKLHVSGKRVDVDLPDAKILSHEIREDSIEIFDEKNSIFNPFKIQDYNTFRKDQMKEMENKAVEQGLLAEARERAAANIELLLSAAIPQEYKLVVT